MRIRQVRPEFWKDDVMADLAPEVRLFYIGLWCVADDAGWIEWNGAAIAAELFPYANRRSREANVSKWSGILEGERRIVRHECGCVEIPHLAEHQRSGGNKVTSALDRHLIHTSTDDSVLSTDDSVLSTDDSVLSTDDSVLSTDSSARANNANGTSTSSVPRGGAGGGGLPHVTAAVEAAWLTACGLTLLGSGNFAITYLDDACRRHPEGDVVRAIEDARRGHDRIPSAQQLAAGARAILDPLPTAAQSKKADEAAAKRREDAASVRRVEATLRRTHEYGAHTEPHPRCPDCRGAA